MTAVTKDRTLRHTAAMLLTAFALSGCGAAGALFPEIEVRPENAPPRMDNAMAPNAPATPRRPVLPEQLVACRGHVLVPAMGMTLVPNGALPPPAGQYMREERLTAPYRIIRPGDRVSAEHSPTRLNVELDAQGRIVGLACG